MVFNIEDTHVTDLERLEKLFLLTMIAFVWCYKIGDFVDENVKKIALKKHGRRSVSVFKYGLDYLSKALITGYNSLEFSLFGFLSCTYKISSKNKEFALYSFLEYYKIVELLGKELIVNQNDKYVIRRRIGNICLILKLPLSVKIKPIKDISGRFIETYIEQEFIPEANDEKYYTGRLSSSFQFSALMLLRFGFNKEDVKTFMVLNNLRNEVVAHSAKDSNVQISVENIIDLAKILEKTFSKL